MTKFLPFLKNNNNIQGYDIQMTLLRGRDLVAKDRHLITRQRTTSDPYVEVFLGIDQRLGKTRTISKNCINPEWNEKFTFHIENNKKTGVIFLKIYDEDVLTDADLMGTLIVPIPQQIITKWYPVETVFGQNATGELEIQFEVTPIKSTNVRFSGQRMLESITPSPDT
eukprot:CAMPEP_0194185472 /NCGR_PEP_ID=MMETSP0154-20130528/42870_1 /TAXON_ID=1049557 /ORGANISM="Thalassiothrix antarctica, Strain L6-D1" /LENGTH=167 /DNA_ID=CAMNT_0038903835 /DNA_START=9 /DNA_END=509 /DNA_ORIENTATION=-